jgi:hypothetical protein
MKEPLKGLFLSSKLLMLDFGQIPQDTPAAENIQKFFTDCEAKGLDPRVPENRQHFNEIMLKSSNAHYLVSRYAEDRSSMLSGSKIAEEGRTFHLGVDVFCKELETVCAPCDGKIIMVGREKQKHSFGHYCVLRPDKPELPHIFFGHLGADSNKLGRCKSGEPIARLGDFIDGENGGWSRHLHLQMLKELPEDSEAPLGYSTKENLPANMKRFPDPMRYFPQWRVK